MNGQPNPRKRLTLLAAACLISVALPAGTAMAQKIKTKPEASVESPAPAAAVPVEFTVDIPTIDAVDSNLDESTLRDILSGNVVSNAEALAGLDATSITVPEITISFTGDAPGSFTLNDIILDDIQDGIATSVSMASSSFDGGSEGSGEFGGFKASDFDIGGILRFYGLAGSAGQTELRTIYKNFSYEGGTLTMPEGNCTLGPITTAEVKVRPMHYGIADLLSVSKAMENEGENPSPETIGRMMRIYADMFTAIESTPIEFGGFDCDVPDSEGRRMAFSIDSMTMGGMKPGIYPSIDFSGLNINVEGDGEIRVGDFSFKQMDLSGPLAVVAAAPATIDKAWLDANGRGLIPAFAGFSFGDVFVDVPNEESPGERIVANVGAFDLSLANYINGIPADLSTSASNIAFDLPANSTDELVTQLIGMGVTSIDLGFNLDAAWNEATNSIDLTELSVNGADLADIALTGTLTNATRALFDLDPNTAMAAGMGVALKNLKLDIVDKGLSDLILAGVAAEQGGDPATMRPIFAGLAEGTIIGFMAGAAEAQKVGGAVNQFVSGAAKSLTIEMTAKQDPGLGLLDFMAAESDPTALIGKVTIDATAK